MTKKIFEAYKQAYKNKGASGVDGVTVDELDHYMYQHKEDIKELLTIYSYKNLNVLNALES